MADCIVYLAQNTTASQPYADDRAGKLWKSLTLLHQNYLQQHPCDVLIFHEGDFDATTQKRYLSQWPRLTFVRIALEVPEHLRNVHIPDFWPDPAKPKPVQKIYEDEPRAAAARRQQERHRAAAKTKHKSKPKPPATGPRKELRFGLGYRHMIRFYSLLVYEGVAAMGYDWYMRLDDDSFLLSPIQYNLFEHLRAKGCRYGYRVDTWDHVSCTFGFPEAVLAHIKAEQLKPTFWYDSFPPDQHLAGPDPWAGCGVWNRHGYYNNFHITEIAFWQQPQVQEFLHYLDRIGGGYKYRWSDLPVQSTAVQIFMPKTQVHKFKDFDYEHITWDINQPDRIGWGGRYLVHQPSEHCQNTKG